MTMQRFDPFREMRRFDRLFSHPMWPAARWRDTLDDEVDHAGAAWSIPMDVHRNDRQLTVKASLPGFAADEVDVSISPDRVLSVKAARQYEDTHQGDEFLMRERRMGSFARSIRLPGDLDMDAASVALESGVLTVALPVTEAAQTRRLPIADATVNDVS